ncbi:hypothetical protein Tsubulata_011514 [Turnera subulata]|uniref:Zinc finger PHD-type domain-containing protein n=1 Tax=Turnera subulata TaxID=218843 RepID=A0A9Q0IZE4_9ROSI|nr:hypothetical protein Tsubulata_011514 [Turnera subulata]
MFIFQYKKCDFTIDVQCALSQENKGRRKLEVVAEDQKEKPTTIEHFSDPHSLRLFNSRWNSIRCTLCNDLVKGPAYGCVECGNYLHISCAEFPLEIQHPYHSQHPLRASTTTSDEQWSSRCKACRELVGIAVYQCRPCGLALDMICANQTLLSSPLKHECHQHNLHYVIRSDDGGDEEKEDTSGESDDEEDEDGGSDDGEEEDTDDSTDDGEEDTEEASDDEESDDEEEEDDDTKKCIACNKYCVKSYYQCLECKFFTHLKCMGFPATLDHSYHFHPLTLVEKFVEDDSGVNYCHACRQKRNPDYPVCLYQDKECLDKAPYVAHIECVVSEVSPVFLFPCFGCRIVCTLVK